MLLHQVRSIQVLLPILNPSKQPTIIFWRMRREALTVLLDPMLQKISSEQHHLLEILTTKLHLRDMDRLWGWGALAVDNGWLYLPHSILSLLHPLEFFRSGAEETPILRLLKSAI